MKKIFFTSLLILFSIQNIAQNVTINGRTENGGKRNIELVTYADRISTLEKVLDKSAIFEGKQFTLKTSINYPTQVFLRIENYTKEFYIEPNHNYEIIIPSFNWEIDGEINPNFIQIELPVDFRFLPENDLNYLITTFDTAFASIISEYRFPLVMRPDKRYIDTVKAYVNKAVGEQTHPYFMLYKEYKFAELELSTGAKSKRRLASDLIIGKPILYNHVAYMDFFSTYFEKYFINGTKKIPFQRIDYWINENKFFPLLDSLGLDTLLRNEVLRELVFLRGMNEAMYSGYFHPASVELLLKTFIHETRFEEHKKIAQNIIEKAKIHYIPPTDPKFVLPNIDKHPVSIEKFKGKWVYLGFVRVKDASSLIELETMVHYRDTLYNNYNIEFVTISCDREFLKLYHFLENNKKNSKYNWTWLHFDNNFDLLKEYNVVSFPTFAIIDPQGRIYSSPAKSPGEGIFVNPKWLIDKNTIQEDNGLH